jgi:REP element-mobilizing transposase RayT
VTAPRQVIAGTTYLVTRRTAQRQFLLKPSELTDGTVGYLLAVAAARFGILLHAVVVLSNHLHLVLTDPSARLPEFQQYLDSLVARAMNAGLGRWESFWAPGSFSAVTLVRREDVVEKTAYALANPVAAGLVASGREWPGLWSPLEAVGGSWRTFERPGHFFSEKGFMPERATIILTPPPGFTVEEFRALASERVAEMEKEAARELEAEGRRFLGVRRVLAQKHTAFPAPGEPRRKLNPRIAARDKWKRIEALLRLKSFLTDYREALAKLRAGMEDVVFPHGTYRLRVFLGVACAGAG